MLLWHSIILLPQKLSLAGWEGCQNTRRWRKGNFSLPIHRAALVQSHDSVGSATSVCSHSSRQKVYRPPSLFKQPTGPELHKGPRGRSTTAPANPHSSYRQENISELVFSMPSTESYMSNMTMSKQRWHIYELMCLEVSKTFTEDEMEWKTW